MATNLLQIISNDLLLFLVDPHHVLGAADFLAARKLENR